MKQARPRNTKTTCLHVWSQRRRQHKHRVVINQGWEGWGSGVRGRLDNGYKTINRAIVPVVTLHSVLYYYICSEQIEDRRLKAPMTKQ